MRTRICAELATGHGGDLSTALAMIEAAASAGADAVKIQHYGAVNPHDPQADWLERSRLSTERIQVLQTRAKACGLEFWATPFNRESLDTLLELGVDRIKIASTEAGNNWWWPAVDAGFVVVSWPWGRKRGAESERLIHLAAIPLYPTPLECVSRVNLLDGWSDHCVGIAACLYAIPRSQWLEVHLTLGEGRSRVMAWDKTPDQIRQLRQFAEDIETMQSGVGQVYRERWTA